jgi:hypothetical protein
MKLNHVLIAAGAVTALGIAVAPSVLANPSHSAPAHPAVASKSKPAKPLRATVLVGGLNNPKHLAFGPDGKLYVTESGIGDPAKANCVPVIGTTGSPTQACVGKTGAVARIDGNRATVVLAKLESVQQQDSGETLGPAAVTFNHGRLAVIMQDFDVQSDGSTLLPGGDEFGKVITAAKGSHKSSWQLFPDVAAFASEHPQTDIGGTPGETAYDSDPYAITPYRGGYAMVDAAANSLLWLSPSGNLSMLARFPAVTQTAPAGVLGPNPVTVDAQAVPTSVAVGPDGALYVGGLRGVPSLPGTADVYRVVPGHAPTVYATGFSAVTDVAFDRHGNLLVLEFATGGLLSPPGTPGALIKVANNRHHTRTTLYSTGLNQPTGLAVARDGSIYISNNGTSAGTATPSGQILKLH